MTLLIFSFFTYPKSKTTRESIATSLIPREPISLHAGCFGRSSVTPGKPNDEVRILSLRPCLFGRWFVGLRKISNVKPGFTQFEFETVSLLK